MKHVTILSAFAILILDAVPAHAFGVGRGAAVARSGPRGGFATGRAVSGTHVGPAGGFASGGARSGSYTGPRGSTVQAGQVGGVARGPLGGVHAGGAQGMRVTTPSGQTYTSGSRGGVNVGPAGGVRAGGSRGAVTTGPYGTAGFATRGGVAVSPGGVRAAGYRGGAAVGSNGGFVAGHRTAYVSPTHFNTWATGVRGYSYHYFTPTWYSAHPVAWNTARWTNANYWAAATYATAASYIGVTAPPVVYDYGSSVVIQDDSVISNGETIATAADYAAQAVTIADTGRSAKPAETDEWQQLGVFGLMQGEEEVAQRIFQLAVNKAGVIRGNYYDAVADNTLPVYGSVDKVSQRAAWSIGEKKDVVFESGLNNLTQQQTSCLVHFGKEKTEQMALVRLEEPKDEKK